MPYYLVVFDTLRYELHFVHWWFTFLSELSQPQQPRDWSLEIVSFDRLIEWLIDWLIDSRWLTRSQSRRSYQGEIQGIKSQVEVTQGPTAQNTNHAVRLTFRTKTSRPCHTSLGETSLASSCHNALSLNSGNLFFPVLWWHYKALPLLLCCLSSYSPSKFLRSSSRKLLTVPLVNVESSGARSDPRLHSFGNHCLWRSASPSLCHILSLNWKHISPNCLSVKHFCV